jgi:hypothetical protein
LGFWAFGLLGFWAFGLLGFWALWLSVVCHAVSCAGSAVAERSRARSCVD